MCGDVACAVSHAPEAGPSRGTLSADLGAAVQVWGGEPSTWGDGRDENVQVHVRASRD